MLLLNMFFRAMICCFCIAFAVQPAQAQSTETTLLGGPCADPKTRRDGQLVSQHRQELKRNNRQAVLALTKQIVRQNCSSGHWWLQLAEAFLAMNDPADATQALQSLYDRKFDGVEDELYDAKSPLHQLLRSNIYQQSTLAASLKRDRRAVEQRRLEAMAKLREQPHPPAEYVAPGACPFECCVYRSWSVLADTPLFDSPGGTRLLGQAKEGELVQALTGEVHLRPVPVRVRYEDPEGFKAKEGSIVFLLDYSGEGWGEAWVDGKVVGAEVSSVGKDCTFPDKSCWGEFVDPADSHWVGRTLWWVKVKTRSGLVGWTKMTQNFGNKDSCG